MALHRTTFGIDAPSEVVWDVLTDFERYSEWNPSVPSIAGELRVGSTLSLTLAMPGRPSLDVKARLTELVPRQRLGWHGNVGADWLFAGDRDFIIEEADGGTVSLTHVEHVRGAMFPFFRLLMGSAVRRHHDGLNAALRQRAEALGGRAGRA